MSSLSALIDFLVNLMRDEHAKTAFEQNPPAALARGGLANVTGQDVRDARMIMRDGGGLRPSGTQHSASADPVREIHHTTTHYQVDEHYHYVDQTFNLINIDDRDTTVVDSFNSNDNNDTHVVAVQDNSRDTTVNVDHPIIQDPVPSAPVDPAPPVPDPDPDPDPVHHEPDLDHHPVDAAIL